MAEACGLLVLRGTEALVGGRFGECERLAARAAAAGPTDAGPGLLAVAACREQGRAAEAEILLRDLVAGHPGDDEARAMLAAVLADLGRDGDARRHLELVDLDAAPLPVCALAAEVVAVLRLASVARSLHGRIAPHAPGAVGFHGSLARHLGLLAHVLDRWHEAAEHFDAALGANRAAGAPLLVAHTCRDYAAVLRLRGKDGDWDRAVDLLAEAADIYRRLEVDSRAAEAEAVLRRSLDLEVIEGMAAPDARNAFRGNESGWALSYAGQSAPVRGCGGLAHLATLVAAGGRPVHVLDMLEGPTEGCLRQQLAAECRSRLGELAARPAVDPVAASLARAEQDRLQAELAGLADGTPSPGEVVDRARRLVGVRIRVALERVDEALPALGRHLRRSVRTGTFCVYEPGRAERWGM